MGLLDKLKKTASQVKDKADDLAEQHGDKVKQGLDKAGGFVDKKTKGKHSEKIENVVGKAKKTVDNLAEPESGEQKPDSASTPPPPPPAGSDEGPPSRLEP